jgi:hypothetical protein
MENGDAQRTAANTADLRGSILRITPTEDGSYTIPAGNLFTRQNGFSDAIAEGTVRPEIYVMGVRNPYRTAVDPESGTLYWGDYGPDARTSDANRGPIGVDEFNRATEPGFYGWPYFLGPNVPFRDYDFETGSSGEPFDPQNPINDSPNNDGLRSLPPARGAMLYNPVLRHTSGIPSYVRSYLPTDPAEFPRNDIGHGGREPIAGPVYRRPANASDGALPAGFDGAFCFMWRVPEGSIRYVSFDDDQDVMQIDRFLPGTEMVRPIDLTVGPGGILYLAEWGTEYAGANDDAGIYRIECSSSSPSEDG